MHDDVIEMAVIVAHTYVRVYIALGNNCSCCFNLQGVGRLFVVQERASYTPLKLKDTVSKALFLSKVIPSLVKYSPQLIGSRNISNRLLKVTSSLKPLLTVILIS